MTFIYIAKWYDSFNQEGSSIYFSEQSDPTEIFNEFEECKNFFKHTVISEGDNYLMFSDGTRVEMFVAPLNTVEVKVEKGNQLLIGDGVSST